MPSANVQLISQVYQALAAQDLPRLLGLLSPDVVVEQTPALPWGGTFEGHAGYTAFLAGVLRQLDSSVTIERLIDAGDQAAVVGRTAGTVRATGHAFDVPLVHLYTIRDGQIVRAQICIDVPGIRPALPAH